MMECSGIVVGETRETSVLPGFSKRECGGCSIMVFSTRLGEHAAPVGRLE